MKAGQWRGNEQSGTRIVIRKGRPNEPTQTPLELGGTRLDAPGGRSFFLTILARPASASPRSTGHEEWVRLDSTGRWAWGVEQSTAVWHGADHFVWTVAIAPEPAEIEGRMVDYVIVLHRFHCADETMQVQALAAYGRSALGKFALTRPDAVAIPVNDHVMESVCNLGMGQAPQ
jgi:hypothetical protein